MKASKQIKLKAILIEDIKMGGYTAYFEQFPNVVAEGDTEDDAIEHLKSIFLIMAKDKLNLAEADYQNTEIPQHKAAKSKSVTICA